MTIKAKLFNKLPIIIRLMFDLPYRKGQVIQLNLKNFPRKWRNHRYTARMLKHVYLVGDKETVYTENELKALLAKRNWGEWKYDSR